MPTISAIIPAYNGVARYLEQAIRSVLAQTYHDIELIVVDDASTDDTARLALRFPTARYFRRAENGGQAAARNDGARLAKGEFLAFLDQDDLWEPNFLIEAVATAAARHDAAVIHADGYQVSEHNEILEYDAAMKHTASITQLLRGGHDVATSRSLFRKSCFDAVGGYDDQLRSEEHTSELQSLAYLVCRLLLEKKKTYKQQPHLFQQPPESAQQVTRQAGER